jgi:hypothetical protein
MIQREIVFGAGVSTSAWDGAVGLARGPRVDVDRVV